MEKYILHQLNLFFFSLLSFFLFTFSFSLLSSVSFAQNKKIDSLENLLNNKQLKDTSRVNTMIKLAKAQYQTNLEQFKQISIEAKILARKIKFDKGEAESLYFIGVYYRINKNIDSAMYFYNLALPKYLKVNF